MIGALKPRGLILFMPLYVTSERNVTKVTSENLGIAETKFA